MSVNQEAETERGRDRETEGKRDGEIISSLRLPISPSLCLSVSLSLLLSSLPLLLRIEQFTQAVADEIERHDRKHHRQSGKDEQVRRDAQETARVVEHHSPTRRGRRHAESQET